MDRQELYLAIGRLEGLALWPSVSMTLTTDELRRNTSPRFILEIHSRTSGHGKPGKPGPTSVKCRLAQHRRTAGPLLGGTGALCV